jgi:chemotaxis protein methyltransferase CheR
VCGDGKIREIPDIVWELREEERLGILRSTSRPMTSLETFIDSPVKTSSGLNVSIRDPISTLESTEFGFEDLKTGVKQLLGFDIFQYNDRYLERRLWSRMRRTNLPSYQQYWSLLRESTMEQEKLFDALTINVTEFFRDHQVYTCLQNDVLPLLLHNDKDRLRIWSAGCADGKEPYSIAMILSEVLGREETLRRVEIIGTDIDRTCLAKAQSGIFESYSGVLQADIEEQLSFLNNPEQYVDTDDRWYTLKPWLRHVVSFHDHDLTFGVPLDHVDIIFCRNVVIYFTKALKERLYQEFYHALNPGGFLFLGMTEILQGKSRELFVPFNPLCRVYRKC